MNQAAMTIDSEMRDPWRAGTKREWSDADWVAAWRMSGRKSSEASAAPSAALFEAAEIGPGQWVLDVASGGGDPSLAAVRIVGSSGHVTVIDVSPGMLETRSSLPGRTVSTISIIGLPAPRTSRSPSRRSTGRSAALRSWSSLITTGRSGRSGASSSGMAAPLFWYGDRFPTILGSRPCWVRSSGSWNCLRHHLALVEAGYRDVEELTTTSVFRWPDPHDEFMQHLVEMGGMQRFLNQLSVEQRNAAMSDALAAYSGFATDAGVEAMTFVVTAGCQ